MRSLFFAALLGVLSVSCGKPKPDKVSSQRLNVPQPNSAAASFALAPGKEKQIFVGSLLLWDPEVKAEQVARLLSATRAFNESYTNFMQDFDAYSRSVLTPTREALKKATDEKEKLQQASSSDQWAVRRLKARSWFENTLKARAATDPAFDAAMQESANRTFTKYCEAKVYELASSRMLASDTFRERPSPSALCEAVYAKLGLFTSPECAAGSAEAPKSYFVCLWKDGLLKTSFAKRYSPEQLAALGTLAGNPTFQDLFAGKFGEGCVRGFDESPITAGDPTEFANLVKRAPRDGTFRCNGLEGDLGFKVNPPTTAPAIERSYPEFVAQSVEQPAPRTDDSLRLVPRTRTAPDGTTGETPSETVEFGATLSAKLFAMGGQNVACEGTQRRTINEAGFVLPLIAPQTEDSRTCNEPSPADLPEIFVNDPALEAANTEVERLRSEWDSQKESVCSANAQGCETDAAATPYCTQQKAFSDKLNVASEPGVSLVLIRAFQMETRATASGATMVSALLNGRPWAHGCFDASGKSVACGEEPAYEGSQESTASLDPLDGKMTLSVRLSDVRQFTDANDEVRPQVEKDFPGRELRLELYSNTFEGFLPYISGKATVMDGSRELVQGVASYLFNRAKEAEKEALCAE